MVYALDHAESAEELVAELLKNIDKEATPVYMIPRLYLISDILYNCAISSGVTNGWTIRTEFENALPEIFEYLNHIFKSETGCLTGASLTEAVNKVIRMWEEKAIYDKQFTNGLKFCFVRPKEFTLTYIKSVSESVKDPEVASKDPEKAYIFPKLVETESYLRDKYQDDTNALEKSCKQNGISAKGSFNEIIARMLSLEYQVHKEDYEEIKKQENENEKKRAEEIAATSKELEMQLIALRNKLMDIQKLHLDINADDIDGSPITIDDVNLLNLPKDLLPEKKSNIEADVEDPIDGIELTAEEMKYLDNHQNEVFFTVEVPITNQ